MTFSVSMTLLQGDPGSFALGDFWSLTQQAGPLRWPIFAILGFGLVLVFLQLNELIRDRRVSRDLARMDLTAASLDQITRVVGQQEESMLSSLQSTMLNVYRNRVSEGLLHDEISNFVSFQQDQFGGFRRRMEFLSDTAGALGLMGTVWGMFTVFFQGTAEQDVILRGMGIALITTLLGLVVSIILNFSATELATFFEKRLEQVSRKSDELRFRLLELAADRPRAEAQSGAVVAAPARAAAAGENVTSSPTAATAERSVASSRSPAGPQPNGAAPSSPVWRYVEAEGIAHIARAGEAVRGLGAVVKNADGGTAPGVPVMVTIAGSGGALDGGGRTLRTNSNALGRIEFGCVVPESVGRFMMDISVPGQPGPAARLEVVVKSGTPDRIVPEGNNQAAIAGMRLPQPLGVRVHDRFGNPASEVPVDFKVKVGSGKLGSGRGEHRVATDATGLAVTPFVVSSEAGQNVVVAAVEGTRKAVEFIAFGTEV